MKKNNLEEKLSNIPNDKYQKFFNKFNEIDKLDLSEWRGSHLLGYFCRKYKEILGNDYAWKFNNPNPTKCFEVWQINSLAAKLSSSPKILKEYIDWAFENKVKNTNYKPRSISFLTKDELVIYYKLNVLLASQTNLNIDRSTSLPNIYKEILNEYGFQITTYGDLAFLHMMSPPPNGLLEALIRLETKGFDQNILKRII